MNTDNQGNASTILAGYYKYGVATLIGGGYLPASAAARTAEYNRKL